MRSDYYVHAMGIQDLATRRRPCLTEICQRSHPTSKRMLFRDKVACTVVPLFSARSRWNLIAWPRLLTDCIVYPLFPTLSEILPSETRTKQMASSPSDIRSTRCNLYGVRTRRNARSTALPRIDDSGHEMSFTCSSRKLFLSTLRNQKSGLPRRLTHRSPVERRMANACWVKFSSSPVPALPDAD